MSDELKQCPFCGATRELYTLDEYGGLCSDNDLITQIFCDNCKSAFENERANNSKELIEAWNSRAEHTYKPSRGKRIDGTEQLYCPECGYEVVNYCPICGAKVVG